MHSCGALFFVIPFFGASKAELFDWGMLAKEWVHLSGHLIIFLVNVYFFCFALLFTKYFFCYFIVLVIGAIQFGGLCLVEEKTPPPGSFPGAPGMPESKPPHKEE
jgi:hypothetical protein